jgi:hypothetical protein
VATSKKNSKATLPEDCWPQCGSCVFARFDKEKTVGVCHRFPKVFASDGEASGFVYPDVSPTEDWCAEYVRKVN